MKNFSMMFHKKFHIKIFLTKNYGFLCEKRAQIAPDFVWVLYVFFICIFFASAVFQFDFSSSVGKIALQRFFLDNAVLTRILFRGGRGLFKDQKRALFTVRQSERFGFDMLCVERFFGVLRGFEFTLVGFIGDKFAPDFQKRHCKFQKYAQ